MQFFALVANLLPRRDTFLRKLLQAVPGILGAGIKPERYRNPPLAVLHDEMLAKAEPIELASPRLGVLARGKRRQVNPVSAFGLLRFVAARSTDFFACEPGSGLVG